jgi:hypothetical protein
MESQLRQLSVSATLCWACGQSGKNFLRFFGAFHHPCVRTTIGGESCGQKTTDIEDPRRRMHLMQQVTRHAPGAARQSSQAHTSTTAAVIGSRTKTEGEVKVHAHTFSGLTSSCGLGFHCLHTKGALMAESSFAGALLPPPNSLIRIRSRTFTPVHFRTELPLSR